MSLIVALPNVAYGFADIVTSNQYSYLNPVWNLFRGHRSHYGRLASTSASTRSITFKMPSGAPAAVNHIFIARADLLLADGINRVVLQSSNDNITYSTAVIDKTFTTSDLKGERKQDLFQITIADDGLKPFWRVEFRNGSGFCTCSKVYLGLTWGDNIIPDDFFSTPIRVDSQPFTSTAGNVIKYDIHPTRYQYNITWDGVSDAECDKIINAFSLLTQYTGLVLYNPSQSQILDGKELVHCELISFIKEEKAGYPNWNFVNLIVQEMIG